MINKTITKPTSTEYSEEIAAIYANRTNLDTGFLAYRDLPFILKKHETGLNALDYGCGTGFSSHILYKQGYHVLGVDINQNMINEAKNKYSAIDFCQIHNSDDLKSNFYDTILCAFVVLEMSSLEDITQALKKIKRALKSTGRLFIITTSEYFPKHNWLTGKNDLSATQSLKSGDQYKVLDTSNNMSFTDYYYSDKDYRIAFSDAGFSVNNIYQPIGKVSDNIEWTTEWKLPPYSIYVCSLAE